MDSSQLISITTFTYLFSTFFYVVALLYKRPLSERIATLSALFAWLIQTGGIGLRWIESYQMGIGRAPLTNMYESVVFFAWTIVLLQLLFERKYKTRVSGALTLGAATLAMSYASLSTEITRNITPLIPALQSNWLISHVVTCFIGYAAFTMSAAFGILYLFAANRTDEKNNFLSSRLPTKEVIDGMIHRSMILGFIWLSAGIITGSIWANSAWGTYWSWDPKETWSLITWFFYAIALHARYTRGWRGKRLAFMAILGFICVLFTYYGVNFLLSGLHSYGSS